MDAERAGTDPALALGQRLEEHYRNIHATAMIDVPICNPALGVAATGFRAYGGRAFGIVTTPWFMNLVALDLPHAPPAARVAMGTAVRIGLPAGNASERDTIGRVDFGSLSSPVFEIATIEAALNTAEEAVRAFFDPSAFEPPPAPAATLDRRDLLRGHLRKNEEAITQ
ncbi:[NiFe] hydrogenase assembly HybE family chaperone [Sinorhizobium terangae]|uniref:[NiFe]-hydrogenase assembly chaperone HybE n=1 Tax=Sinorhizobium terangae TaxID=110322 RepID=A0A6N7LLI5_SINTE|nr:[NiFe]-hydrogenase assembly chaperone HybE [Sinorhizobium terangae]MBB4188552.1 [NiFe] hydrogenase assembly HybE family chaperone [Sinorhizobium terangae]MQX18160.1 [NiFe]-hydrogenase assembly chaperone HybE [Sinorhizobium terangae]